MKKRTLGLGLVGAAIALVSVSASATVMIEYALEEIVRDSDTIVHATVVRSEVRMSMAADTFEPETVTTLRVHEWIAGAGGDEVRLREHGGVWQGGGLRFDGIPTYAPGEEVILFLERRPEAPYDLRTYGMEQGKFIVQHGIGGVPSTVRRDLGGISFVRWSEGQQTVSEPDAQPVVQLDNFIDYVRRLRREAGEL